MVALQVLYQLMWPICAIVAIGKISAFSLVPGSNVRSVGPGLMETFPPAHSSSGQYSVRQWSSVLHCTAIFGAVLKCRVAGACVTYGMAAVPATCHFTLQPPCKATAATATYNHTTAATATCHLQPHHCSHCHLQPLHSHCLQGKSLDKISTTAPCKPSGVDLLAGDPPWDYFNNLLLVKIQHKAILCQSIFLDLGCSQNVKLGQKSRFLYLISNNGVYQTWCRLHVLLNLNEQEKKKNKFQTYIRTWWNPSGRLCDTGLSNKLYLNCSSATKMRQEGRRGFYSIILAKSCPGY